MKDIWPTNKEIEDTLRIAKNSKRPNMIICNTIKGKGVSFMENSVLWHYRCPEGEDFNLALIKAFNKLNLPLIIIGDGPERLKLEKIANSNIKFLRKISDREVEKYMSRCKAFVYAGIEDFGIAPVEAMASGAPVIAYGKGGILDTVNCLNEKSSTKFKWRKN